MVNKFYDLAVFKDSDHTEDDIQAWIDYEIKGKWSKREFKTKTNYRFYDLADAFRFRFRWTNS